MIIQDSKHSTSLRSKVLNNQVSLACNSMRWMGCVVSEVSHITGDRNGNYEFVVDDVALHPLVERHPHHDQI